MNKIYTFIAIAAASLTASAAVPGGYRSGQVPELSRVPVAKKALSRAGGLTSADFTGPIITEAPEGETKHYSASSYAIFNTFGVAASNVDGTVCDLTFTPDGKVYWLNPLSNAPFGSYIVGDLEGNKITFNFPQHLHDEDYGFMIYEFYTAMMDIEYVEGAGLVGQALAENQTLTLTIAEDGTITQDAGQPMLAMGDWDIFDDKFYFDGFADSEIVMTPFDESAVKAPESVQFQDWALREEYNNPNRWLVKVGFDGSDVYIKGISAEFPEWTIRGTVEGDKVVVPNNQYVGSAYYRYDYFANGGVEYYFDEDLQKEVGVVALKNEPYVFNYNPDSLIMTSPNADCVMLFNEGTKYVSPLQMALNPKIYSQGEIKDYTPLFPSAIKAENDWEAYGQIGMRFTAMNLNVDGQLLPLENLGYEVFVDDELFTFEPGVYPRITEAMTEVPYSFSDGYDFQYIAGTDYHYVYFYFNTMKRLGVRLVYTDPEGNKHYSEISSIPTDFSGIEDIELENAPVEYFNLQGVRVANPQAGVYIRRQAGKATKVYVK